MRRLNQNRSSLNNADADPPGGDRFRKVTGRGRWTARTCLSCANAFTEAAPNSDRQYEDNAFFDKAATRWAQNQDRPDHLLILGLCQLPRCADSPMAWHWAPQPGRVCRSHPSWFFPFVGDNLAVVAERI